VSSTITRVLQVFFCSVTVNHHSVPTVPHLVNRDIFLPVDLVSRGVEPVALLHVLVEDAATLHVAQAELTQVELG